MSTILKFGVRGPHRKGMKVGSEETDSGQYQYLGYTHPDCDDTFFACHAGKVAKWEGQWCHEGLTSAVRSVPIPLKPDFNVRPTHVHAVLMLMYRSGLSHQASTTVSKRWNDWYVCRRVNANGQFWRDYHWFLDRNPNKETEATDFAHRRVKEQDRKQMQIVI